MFLSIIHYSTSFKHRAKLNKFFNEELRFTLKTFSRQRSLPKDQRDLRGNEVD